jgi:transposase
MLPSCSPLAFGFKPETILRWHRKAVRRKWAFKQKQAGGRPRTYPEIEAWIIQMAHENPRWGHKRIHGELGKVGDDLNPSTVANIMKRHGIPPAPQRGHSPWRIFLNHYRGQILCGGQKTNPLQITSDIR